MENWAKKVLAGEPLYVVSKTRRPIKSGAIKKKIGLKFNAYTYSTPIFCYLYLYEGKERLYVSPYELRKIPEAISSQINIIDCRSKREQEQKPLESLLPLSKEAMKPRQATLSGKIVLTDDSIMPRCKSVSIIIGDEKYRVIGYRSEASGSLLIPASIFIKNVPMDSWDKLKLTDPKRLLPSQGPHESPYEIGNGDLQDCSILFKYGYSVRKSVPYDIRRKALNAALADHAVTKEQAIRHINHLIALNQARYPDACARWRDDIEYLNQLPDSDS